MKKILFVLLCLILSMNAVAQTSISITGPAFGTNNNTFLGVSTPSITSGSGNTFLGFRAGNANSTGADNIFIGSAGYRNTTGVSNVFVGNNAGSVNTTGLNNTSIGTGSGAYNNGNANVFMGVLTGHYTQGDGNVFLGSHAGYRLNGSNNVIIGSNSVGGYPGTSLTGNNNVFIGTGSYANASGLTNAIAIGKNARVGTSNTMILGGTGTDGVNVGIGLINPTAKLDVLSEIKVTSNTDINRTYRITSGSRQEIFAQNDLLTFSGQNHAVILNNNNDNQGSFFITNKFINNPLLFMVRGIDGKTGVGTTNFPTTIGGANISAYKLFVKGGILTEEVRVRTGWADYVFDDNYTLKPLSEVENFIEENGHLPNVPSAKQVEEEGLSLGEISKIQQEKIEELTLYIIELNKRIENLEAKKSGN